MYIVTKTFYDLHDVTKTLHTKDGDIPQAYWLYNVGDEYPRVGAPEPTPERVAELAGDKNAMRAPLIQWVEPVAEPVAESAQVAEPAAETAQEPAKVTDSAQEPAPEPTPATETTETPAPKETPAKEKKPAKKAAPKRRASTKASAKASAETGTKTGTKTARKKEDA